MKKRLVRLLTLSVCVLLFSRSLAAGKNDFLVSVSYLKQTFLPSLEQLFLERANERTQEVYNGALAQMFASAGQDSTSADKIQSDSLTRGDAITLSPGSVLLLGDGTASASSGLVDATAGTEQAPGLLAAGHRYINAQETGAATVTVLSDSARLMLEGSRSVKKSGLPTTGFADLTSSAWYYDAVCWAWSKRLVDRVDETHFAPDPIMDRATLANAIYRLEDPFTPSYTGVFSDVPEDAWYAAGVEWAASVHVVNGVGEGRFAPDGMVTREQLSAMLYRYAKESLGMDVSQTADITRFSDWQQTGEWFFDSMAWAVGTGLILGGDNNQLLPKLEASRAQVVTILQRFDSWRTHAPNLPPPIQ